MREHIYRRRMTHHAIITNPMLRTFSSYKEKKKPQNSKQSEQLLSLQETVYLILNLFGSSSPLQKGLIFKIFLEYFARYMKTRTRWYSEIQSRTTTQPSFLKTRQGGSTVQVPDEMQNRMTYITEQKLSSSCSREQSISLKEKIRQHKPPVAKT